MIPRRPDLNFAAVPYWHPDEAFSQCYNASSVCVPAVERFLNRVMARARTALTSHPDSESIRRDIGLFIKQESNHTAVHAAFNQALIAAGYPGLVELEAEFSETYEKLLRTRSLKFLTAYCEGFETIGPILADVWLGEIEDTLIDSDPNVVTLWKWHMMEEYEHRTVCYDVYHTLFGGYWTRIYALFFQLKHIQGFTNRVRKHLFACDRAKMSRAERAASVAAEKAARRRLLKLVLPRMARALSPFYDPRKLREPKLYASYQRVLQEQLAASRSPSVQS